MGNMKNTIILLFIIISLPAYCSYRPIIIKKELKAASFVGEIKFIGYDSIYINRYSDYIHPVKTDSITGKDVRVYTQDSIWVIIRIYFQKLASGNDSIYSADMYSTNNWICYNSRPDSLPRRISNGFWPRINDSCLIVIDSTQRVSLFALIDDERYIFWDPYPNWGYNSVFVFDALFECYPLDGRNSTNHAVFKHNADFFKMKYACQYHCAINKKTLWDEIINESP